MKALIETVGEWYTCSEGVVATTVKVLIETVGEWYTCNEGVVATTESSHRDCW